MDKPADLSPADASVDEPAISPFGVANVILRHRRTIVLLAAVGTILGLIAALRVVPRYEAAVRFVNSPSSGRSVTGVGGDMGLVQQRDPFDYYSSLLTSTDVLDKVLDSPLASGGTIADALTKASTAAVPPGRDALRMRLRAAGATLESSTRARNPLNLAVLSVRAGWTDPQMAADLANAFVAALAEYDQTIRTSAAKDRRQFIANQIAETEKLLKTAEENLRTFKQNNRLLSATVAGPDGLISAVPPDLALIRDQLQREVTVQGELYLTLKKGFEQARIAELDEASPIVILDKAVPPRGRTGRSRSTLVMAGGVLGLLAGLVVAGAVELRRRTDLSSPDAREFVGLLAEVRQDFTSIRDKATRLVASDEGPAAPSTPPKP